MENPREPKVVYKGTKRQCQDTLQLLGPGHHIQSSCGFGCYNPTTLCRYDAKRHGER